MKRRTFTKRYLTEREKQLKKFKDCMAKCQKEKPWVAPCELGCWEALRRKPRL
jgi:hypothetical protein